MSRGGARGVASCYECRYPKAVLPIPTSGATSKNVGKQTSSRSRHEIPPAQGSTVDWAPKTKRY